MKKRIVSVLMAVSMAAALTAGCGGEKTTGTSAGSGNSAEADSAKEAGNDAPATESTSGGYEEKKVLRVAMECAYAPFNWTQESEDVANGDKAVKITNSDGYAYGYDVKTAKMLADALDWDLEIYKTEWSAIVLGLDAGDYDCIIGGMCYSEERDKTLDFTTPYYIRDVVLTVKDDGPYADISVIDYPTSKSAVDTMSGLKILDIDLPCPSENSNDVCIAIREGDTELKDLLQGAMEKCNRTTDNKDGFDAQMDEMLEVQPSAN